MAAQVCQLLMRLAERMESEAARFYRERARDLSRNDSARLLLTLAEEEESHREVFARLLAAGSPDWKAEPSFLAYLEGLARGLEADLQADESTGVWDRAVRMEMDSLLLYLELSHLLPPEQALVLQPVIQTERQHYLKVLRLKAALSDDPDQE